MATANLTSILRSRYSFHGDIVDRASLPTLLISAGFDAHRNDPLAGMDLSSAAFGRFTEMLLGRPILTVLEGGYDLDALAESARAHVQALVRG